jgi:hypothetical protein
MKAALFIATLGLICSCKHIESVKVEGQNKRVSDLWQVPLRSKTLGTTVLIDTVTGHVLERVKFNSRLDRIGRIKGSVKTTYYDSTGQVEKIFIVRNGNHVTEQYTVNIVHSKTKD